MSKAKGKFLIKDGRKLAVIRPEDPAKALASARQVMEDERKGRITADEAHRRFNLITTEQAYTFVGVAAVDAEQMLDHDGTILDDKLQPGDSFVDYEELMESQAAGKA